MTEPKQQHPEFVGGRPPKNPMEKLSIPVRAMVTPVVTQVLESAQNIHGFSAPAQGRVASDVLRLAVFRLIQGMYEKDPAVLGTLTWEQFVSDPTWDSLKESGHV